MHETLRTRKRIPRQSSLRTVITQVRSICAQIFFKKFPIYQLVAANRNQTPFKLFLHICMLDIVYEVEHILCAP